MTQVSEFLGSFQRSLDAPALPERLSARYQLVSALGHRAESGAFLLRRKADDAPFVLKIDTGGQDLSEEFRLLGRLPKGLAPEPVECFKENGVQYLVRTYLAGQTLAEVWEAGPDYDRWADLGEQLCGILSKIHSLGPPVVHRDIKPENIILSPEGRPYLIDFGIARNYKPEQETDTVHMGTRATAAPEQYGFAQSDQRTDLYALGVTLRWMATGSYRPDSLESAACPGWVKRFLRRAAAFDPADRFPSADAMADALRMSPRRARDLRGRAVSFSLGAAAALLCVAAVVGIIQLRAASGVNFDSPLLEAAVRAELDKPEGVITREDLKRVRRLAVVGQELLEEEQELRCDIHIFIDDVELQDPPRGDIADLSILAEMPDLTALYLCVQKISDLSPLEGLPLQELYLVDNNIRDLSPLEQLPELRVLHLVENPATDLSPLASLTRLRELNLSRMAPPESLAPLRDLPLEQLYVTELEPQDGDWSVVSTLWALDRLWMDGASPASIEVLAECGHISDMRLWNYKAQDLESLPSMPRLRALSLSRPLPSYEGIQRQKDLQYFSFWCQGALDLTPIAAMESLTELNLYGDPPPGLRLLTEIGTLCQVVVHTEEFAAAIEAECPGHGFQIILE